MKKKYPDLMIDLETVSTRCNATILSIGYQFFDRVSGELGLKKEIIVEYLDGQEDRHICPNTQKWWSEQGEHAQQVLSATDRVPLNEALNMLTADIVRNAIPAKVRVYGNGSSFDITILEHAYRASNSVDAPWRFYNVLDVRSIVDIGYSFGLNYKKTLPFTGVPHNAADDAEHQAKYIHDYYRAFKEINSGEVA